MNSENTRQCLTGIGCSPDRIKRLEVLVEALKELAKNDLTIQMSMYGGFEQVGSIGQRLPSQDVQTNTSSGDIVLYSSSQLVVFYGSNSWAYTRLGRITDQSAEEMRELLSRGDVTITISAE